MIAKMKKLEVDLANGLGSAETARLLLEIIELASKTGPGSVTEVKECELKAVVEELTKELDLLKKEIELLKAPKEVFVEAPKAEVAPKVEEVKVEVAPVAPVAPAKEKAVKKA